MIYMITDMKPMEYLVVHLSALMILSQHFIQTSNGQSCHTMLPANSQTILDSNTYHSINMAGQIVPFDILGWIRIDADGVVYNEMERFGWTALLMTGACGPEYRSCPRVSETIVNSSLEMNWIVTDYYENEGNVIHIRVMCTAIRELEFPTDCRDAFQIFYYESDQDITITNSHLSQFLPADSNKTVSGVVSAEFTKSKKGFFIGIFNNIPCPELTEFLFYYFECPAKNTSDLYSLPATLAPNSTEVFVPVNISCPTNSLHRDPLRLVAECYWDGTWRLPAESVCECEAGYYLSMSNANSSMPCVMCRVDTYKGETGNSEECSVCPFRSSTHGMEGSSECLCDEDWYRGEGESVSESCGQSPSAVVNLRVERGDKIVSRVVWDEPLYLGYRNKNELRYNVSYYPCLTPSSEKSVRDLRENGLVLSSGDVEDSTEYVFVVTSWNSVSCVSGVFNRANVTVLSSFPTLLNISYNETTGYLQWDYEPYGKRDYMFEVSYTTTVSSISNRTVSQLLNSEECNCSTNLCTCVVSTLDLSSTHTVAFRLLVNVSGDLMVTNLNFSFTLSSSSTLAPYFSIQTMPSFGYSPMLILQVLIGVSFGLFILLFVFVFLSLLIWVQKKCFEKSESFAFEKF